MLKITTTDNGTMWVNPKYIVQMTKLMFGKWEVIMTEGEPFYVSDNTATILQSRMENN